MSVSELRYLTDIPPQYRQILKQYVTVKFFPANSKIFDEGESSDALYFLISGKASVLKYDTENRKKYIISQLEPIEIIGEMGFLDNSPRSTSVHTLEDSIFEIFHKKNLNLLRKENPYVYTLFMNSVQNQTLNRFRKFNLSYIDKLKSENAMLTSRIDFGKFLMNVIVALGLSNLLNKIFSDYHLFQANVAVYFNWLYLFLALIPLLYYFLYQSHHPLSDVGLTLQNWKQSLREGALVSVVIILIALCAKYVIIYILNFQLRAPPQLGFASLLYVFHVIAQEFIARGLIQGLITYFFHDKTGWYAIFMTSILFAIVHLHLPLLSVLTIFLASVILGKVYFRTRNLLGAILVHLSFGVSGYLLGIIG